MRPLHEGWTLTAVSGGTRFQAVPANVPGCVHTDLLAARLIDDPYLDDNETRLSWIGRTDWRYDTVFRWDPDQQEHTDLVCAGLDTVATVTLNGTLLGRTANQHRSYRFPVRHLLKAGENTLSIRFDSAYGYAEAQRAALGHRPGAYREPYPFIRKSACNFGWDWGPTVVTAGIWRPIGLESWSAARLAEVRPEATLDPERAAGSADGLVKVAVRVQRADERPLTVTATVAGQSVSAALAPGARTAELALRVADPELWWPRGLGEQRLHELTVELAGPGTLDRWSREIGFRRVELDTAAFALSVNGRPVKVRGANWIPDDCFPNRVTPDRLAQRFEQAAGANINLLRVWGGGLYESEEFYRLADATGMLVWQDFLFACAAYPEEEPLHSEVAAEARENITRLAPHPSLVLWCGNNENIEGRADWGWTEELAGRSWGAGYYYDLLPGLLAELDPTRPYWPGSPYSGRPDLPPNDPAEGTIHIWDVWNREDYTRYAEYHPRFVSEFGFQAPPAHSTLRRSVGGELAADAPMVLHHQKAIDGNAKLLLGLKGHLPLPNDYDDWHYLTQLNQARAIAFGVEHFRSLAPLCRGTIVWQLNDCWPVTSWSAVDGDGRRKPLWYALRRVYADRLITLQQGEAVLVNDSTEEWSGELRLARHRFDGELLAGESRTVAVPAGATVRVELPAELATAGQPGSELLTAALGGQRAVRLFTEDLAAELPPAEFDSTVTRTAGGYQVTVTAHTLLRDLALFPDRLAGDAAVDEMLVTLLPGESATFQVSTGSRLDPDELVGAPVLRCVNQIRPTAG
ncbi:glycoside hydrolase family 2 protein [Kitasatospora sp. NPDC006697]|uniref:glycoside hydrolase family 2 protein n=1 Tax=Kitasatospora sp. NPDC006697 TaxID=3364020 RepID=UPI003679C9DD